MPEVRTLQVRIASAAELPDVHAVRHEVFVLGQGVPPDLEHDAADATAVHVIALLDGEVVGTGRLLERSGQATVGRMAVRESARRRGIGTALLRELERQASDRNLTAVHLHAQVHAVTFYRRAGYAPVGERFFEAGIEHVEMRKPLPVLRPVTDADSEALIALIEECFAEYPGCVLDVDAEEPWLRAPATAYGQVGGQLLVATLEGTVVACGGYRGGQVKNIYVAAVARRAGLGSRLVRAAEERAKADGERRIELWTDTRFTDAHQMYRRLGYRQTGRTRELHDLSDTTEYHFAKNL